jgi:hypothetical protein
MFETGVTRLTFRDFRAFYGNSVVRIWDSYKHWLWKTDMDQKNATLEILIVYNGHNKFDINSSRCSGGKTYGLTGRHVLSYV